MSITVVQAWKNNGPVGGSWISTCRDFPLNRLPWLAMVIHFLFCSGYSPVFSLTFQIKSPAFSRAVQIKGGAFQQEWRHSVIWQVNSIHKRSEFPSTHLCAAITNIYVDQNRLRGDNKGQHGISILTSVSVPFKSSKLLHSAMNMWEQMDRKPFLGKGDLKASKMTNSSFF